MFGDTNVLWSNTLAFNKNEDARKEELSWRDQSLLWTTQKYVYFSACTIGLLPLPRQRHVWQAAFRCGRSTPALTFSRVRFSLVHCEFLDFPGPLHRRRRPQKFLGVYMRNQPVSSQVSRGDTGCLGQC